MIAYFTNYKNKPLVQWRDFLLFGFVWMTYFLEFWRGKEGLFNGCATISVFYLKTGSYVLLLTHTMYARRDKMQECRRAHRYGETKSRDTHSYVHPMKKWRNGTRTAMEEGWHNFHHKIVVPIAFSLIIVFPVRQCPSSAGPECKWRIKFLTLLAIFVKYRFYFLHNSFLFPFLGEF